MPKAFDSLDVLDDNLTDAIGHTKNLKHEEHNIDRMGSGRPTNAVHYNAEPHNENPHHH